MNLYPEQLRRMADICEALDKIDGADIPDSAGVTLGLKQGIPIVDEYGEVYGYVGDEVGGSWSVWIQKENPYKS
jgi:hypothetical protein